MQFFQNQLPQSFARDNGNYNELVVISLLIVSKELEPRSFKMQYSGAFDKARWMDKLINFTKIIIILFTESIEQFPKGEILLRKQLVKLEQFVVFVILVYAQWWLISPLAAIAFAHDLILVENLERFVEHDSLVARNAQVAFTRHT